MLLPAQALCNTSCRGSLQDHQSQRSARALRRGAVAAFEKKRAISASRPLGRHRVICSAQPVDPPPPGNTVPPPGEDEQRSRQKALPTAPRFELTPDEVFELHWGHLQQNDAGHVDAGLEVLYKFANFDPFARSSYFGRSLDLGQFERFRRMFYTPQFRPLVNHVSCQVLSTLQIAEGVVRQRALVKGFREREDGIYALTLRQHLGGRRDGYWYADSLVCDSLETD